MKSLRWFALAALMLTLSSTALAVDNPNRATAPTGAQLVRAVAHNMAVALAARIDRFREDWAAHVTEAAPAKAAFAAPQTVASPKPETTASPKPQTVITARDLKQLLPRVPALPAGDHVGKAAWQVANGKDV